MAALSFALQRREKQQGAANLGLLTVDSPAGLLGRLWKWGSWQDFPRVRRSRFIISKRIGAVKIIFKASGLFAEDLLLSDEAVTQRAPCESWLMGWRKCVICQGLVGTCSGNSLGN